MRTALLLLLIYSAFACKTNRKPEAPVFEPQFLPGPPVMVYKTKADYRNLVPVLLSEQGDEIIAYPHPSDLKTETGYALPTQLKNGYLLDNRGIGAQTAFLSLTYEAYAGLSSAPSLEKLKELIVDKAPFSELCNCGHRQAFTDVEVQLNQLIEEKQLRKKCKILIQDASKK